MYAAEKSPDKRTNGEVEVNNVGVVNSPDLSPVKNVRNGEAEETEVRKTKVSVSLKVDCCAVQLSHTCISLIFAYPYTFHTKIYCFLYPEMAN